MNTPLQYRPEGRSAAAIAESVEAALRTGRIGAGDALPPVRTLAQDLGVSPTTVAAAYRELRRRGIVAGAGRAGTRVRGRPPLASRMPLPVPAGVRDLVSGGPDPDLLPALPRVVTLTRRYGEAAVLPALERAAADRLAADGVDPAHLAVVGGALDGVERVLGVWLRVGDRVAVEDPGYSAVLDLVAAMGLVAVPVPVDGAGMDPAGLAAALEAGARAVVVTPRAQNPTGAAWDASRAEEIGAVVRRYPDAVLVEDDHAGPVAGVPALTAARGARRWATVRSVSKWLGPDLRLAVLAADEATASAVAGRQALGTGWVSHLLQQAVATLWTDPAIETVLERATATYERRRSALRAALAADGIAVGGRSGLTTWVPVPDEAGVTAGLLAAGWAVVPGERFRLVSRPAIRIAHATLQPPEAAVLAGDLGRLLRQRRVRTD
ncbi:MAG: aminotransferase class I/II-fold pyridoxal phosphate-dependent enzyme [Actinomycetota bacterium]|jgi:DNA-binding transcriptional MocR family regulator|nr:aminotransferase class I/II-fold pyridoxal phosphate-dependent enzyme [Actinomycetota bacterium]